MIDESLLRGWRGGLGKVPLPGNGRSGGVTPKKTFFTTVLICLYTSFSTCFLAKFISLVVALEVFLKKENISTATFLINNKTIQNYF